ncbi:hypothetical protein KPNJ1_02464 [Klebsiella pneumoniae 30660/NJST258_1]|nr:hypothetical protein KPNJ1_02464 [Klebsiella pneumoniae 30660/NJST258_1]
MTPSLLVADNLSHRQPFRAGLDWLKNESRDARWRRNILVVQ